MSVSEHLQQYQSTQDVRLPSETVLYDGAMIEDLQPLAEQGRLVVNVNGIDNRPPYIRFSERTGTIQKMVDRDVNPQVDETDFVESQTSVGFTIEVHLRSIPRPHLSSTTRKLPQSTLTLMGVHEQWSAYNCGISEQSHGRNPSDSNSKSDMATSRQTTTRRNDDGHYELTFEVDGFERSEL